MESINKGLIYTTDDCIGCNRCIAQCPIMGANVAVIENGINRIMVDQNKCIACGHCLQTCSHRARAYRDDTRYFFDALESGESISVLVSPAFFITYGEKANKILSYIKKCGAKLVYNTGFGMDIMAWAFLKCLDENGSDSMISQQCSCIVDFIEKFHPALLPNLVPVQSPAMCMAIYAREYLKDTNIFAYIGSCISRKSEFTNCADEEYIRYNVTFTHLDEYLSTISLDESNQTFSDDDFMFTCEDCLVESLHAFIGKDKFVREIDGRNRVYKYLGCFEERMNSGQPLPLMVNITSCTKGCLFGSASGNSSMLYQDDLYISLHKLSNRLSNKNKEAFAGKSTPEERKQFVLDFFKDLDLEKFRRKFNNKHISSQVISDDQINDIFNAMHKTTPESRHIDCHSCGYHSCRNMATAIALGYTEKDNCVHYVRDENTRLFLTDVFTEIPNTNAYAEYCRRLLSFNKGIGYSAIRFNIRNFTLINKNYGFKRGDTAIKEFSSIICSFAKEDEIMARISEDNFIGMVRTERLSEVIHDLNSVTLHIKTAGGIIEYPVSVHLGVYTLTGADSFPGDIIRKMATTLSAIRRRHDNRVIFFNEELAEDLHKEMSIERMLPNALQNGEFIVYFQPKVRIQDKLMTGAEALVRWKHDGVLIPPIDFIPISEESGFVCRIDFYVLELVCQTVRNWLDTGIDPVRVSVNFSKKHFIHDDVAEKISEVVDAYNIPHEYIEVEFTETAYTDGYQNLALTLTKLKNFGIATSIDDFGTGYSSLNLLQDLDFSALKLDKSLLGSKCYDERNKTVIANIIRMAKELNMEIIAEGVETMGEYNLLHQLSCDLIQGYIFDKPLPEEEFVSHLADKHYSL